MSNIKSTFEEDLKREQKLGNFLDKIYNEKLTAKFEINRKDDKESQKKGIDLLFTDKSNNKITYKVDEKAQLDYINKSLPTFAFEVLYGKNKIGWLMDSQKETTHYFLITNISEDNENNILGCDIYLVKRESLIALLANKNLDEVKIGEHIKDINENKQQGKVIILELDEKQEGYFFKSQHKAESPINIVLKLDFLIKNKVAKQIHKS